MSYDRTDYRASYTDLELEAGVHRLMEDDQSDKARERVDCPKSCAVLTKQAAKMVAGVQDKATIVAILSHSIIKGAILNAEQRYFAKEAIPLIYSKLLHEKNCLEILIRGILYKVCKIGRTATLELEIDDISVRVRRNASGLIVYDRVGLIRQFIYGIVNSTYGDGSSERIPVQPMRNLLAVSRLHLNLVDFGRDDAIYSTRIDMLSTRAAEKEYAHPRATALAVGKQFIPYWKVRHLKTITHYFSLGNRKKLLELQLLNKDLPLEEFSLLAINTYASS